MSSQATSGGLTALEVAKMFESLGLKVCDDGALIQQKIQEQRARNLRDLNNPSEDVRSAAEWRMKNANALESRRRELIRVVYEAFENSTDLKVMFDRSSGVRTVPLEFSSQLRTIARQEYSVDDAIAAEFASQYMRDRDLTPGNIFGKCESVRNFAAHGRVGSVELRWDLPPDCRSVRILRSEPSAAQAAVVFEGYSTGCEDRDARPGVPLVYSAVPLYDGDNQGPQTQRSAVALAEVAGARAQWTGTAVRLSWQSPSPSARVVIFRRVGGRPQLQRSIHGWEPKPSDPGTKIVHDGPGSADAWEDHEVAEGCIYHYVLVADFGPGNMSQGVGCQVAVPRPPAAVASLTAEYHQAFEEGKSVHQVVLTWPAVSDSRQVEYVVVRREGDVAASHPADGSTRYAGTSLRAIDADVEPGRRYCYAVYSRVATAYSRLGAAAPAVDILADVTGLDVLTGDQMVELTWQTPQDAQVIVRRGVTPPASPADGVPVLLAGNDCARDADGLTNGRCYHYLVVCSYRPDGKTERHSPGVRIQASPGALPDPIRAVRLTPRPPDIVCQFDPPAHGQAVVLRAASAHGLPLGRRLPADDLRRLGRPIALSGANEAVDPRPDLQEPVYCLFTVSGTHAVVGACGACVNYPDVSHLRIGTSRDGAVLRWQWPPGCSLAIVARRKDAWPDGPRDPKAVATPCLLAPYQAAGNRYVDGLGQDWGRYHYVVYAKAPLGPGEFWAGGVSADCRSTLDWRPWTELRYRIEPGPASGQLTLRWTIQSPVASSRFSGFVLRADESWVPDSRAAGVELFRWQPEMRGTGEEYRALVSLAPARDRRWNRLYCKGFVLDPAQEPTTLIVHPDTCLDLARGQSGSAQRAPRGYRTRVPKTIICPICLGEFPIEEMLFGSYEGDPPVRGLYTWWDRLRGRPPRQPTGSCGQRLHRKLCPCSPRAPHDLPFSAGLQESLLVGLIGAKSSGKSHYIASLVDRFQNHVAADFSAAMIPCTDDTPKRYQREFHAPLFDKRAALPMTIGQSPPLVYDLTFDGSLWHDSLARSVTLALYDTAGEAFGDAAEVRRVVRYLRAAAGIIVLIDPLQIPEVRQALARSVPLPERSPNGEPNQILGNILGVLENGKVLESTESLSIPVAVALAKCDVLRDAGLIESNRLWNLDRRHVAAFDRQLHDDTSGMMGEWVHRWSRAAYSTLAQRFSRVAFFGVSATGCSLDQRSNRYPFVSPWRVEDPLLWLLAELGVVPFRES